MSTIPAELRYANTHEWARLESDGTVSVGITDHAQEALGDVVYIELPALDSTLTAEQPVGVVESVKAASDIHAPISGTVIAVNDGLTEAPESVNTHPYQSWFYRIQPSSPEQLQQLLDANGYQAIC